MPELSTERLVLRAWRDTDLAPFAALNADPRVMEHFASPLSAAESDAMVERIRQQAATQFAQPESERGFSRRCAILRSYAVSADASVERVASGLRLTADDGHLSIDDTVDAWLDADRGAIAIEVCQAVEASPC